METQPYISLGLGASSPQLVAGVCARTEIAHSEAPCRITCTERFAIDWRSKHQATSSSNVNAVIGYFVNAFFVGSVFA